MKVGHERCTLVAVPERTFWKFNCFILVPRRFHGFLSAREIQKHQKYPLLLSSNGVLCKMGTANYTASKSHAKPITELVMRCVFVSSEGETRKTGTKCVIMTVLNGL